MKENVITKNDIQIEKEKLIKLEMENPLKKFDKEWDAWRRLRACLGTVRY
jgi:hypothetical protein